MTSKTFKSDNELAKTISITRSQGRVLVEIEDPKHLIAINLSDNTAPAIALAILEAAGYGEEVVTDGSPDGHVRVAKYYLYEGVKAHASITAEAKEQAELEAEALELYQLWETLQSDDETVWLAVARRAREINKEATNGRE